MTEWRMMEGVGISVGTSWVVLNNNCGSLYCIFAENTDSQYHGGINLKLTRLGLSVYAWEFCSQDSDRIMYHSETLNRDLSVLM